MLQGFLLISIHLMPIILVKMQQMSSLNPKSSFILLQPLRHSLQLYVSVTKKQSPRAQQTESLNVNTLKHLTRLSALKGTLSKQGNTSHKINYIVDSKHITLSHMKYLLLQKASNTSKHDLLFWCMPFISVRVVWFA